jgi:hypothetical protein
MINRLPHGYMFAEKTVTDERDIASNRALARRLVHHAERCNPASWPVLLTVGVRRCLMPPAKGSGDGNICDLGSLSAG